MLPAERGEVSEELIRNILGLAQSGNGALEVPRVPQDDFVSRCRRSRRK